MEAQTIAIGYAAVGSCIVLAGVVYDWWTGNDFKLKHVLPLPLFVGIWPLIALLIVCQSLHSVRDAVLIPGRKKATQ